MGREPLKNGTKLVLRKLEGNAKETFKIQSFIGAGGVCLAYDVICQNGMAGRLKEFCPIHDSKNGQKMFIRRGVFLIENPLFQDEESKIYLKKRFLHGFEKMKDIHRRMEKSRNEMPGYGDLYCMGDTMYWFMTYDEGTCYSEIKDESLSEICEIGLAVTRAIDRYHKLGYLHLDIKDANIFVLSQTRDYIKLIDFDNILPKTQIQNVEYVIGFTNSTSAPEVVNGYRERICEASDYYSIGAMIYRRIFEHEVTPMQQVSTARFFSESLLEAYGDEKWTLSKLLEDFFKRTLVRNPCMRFKTASQMERQLIKIIEIAKPIEKELRYTDIQKNVFYLFHQFPMHRYSFHKSGIYVLLDGEGDVSDILFKSILGCCGQYLDMPLHMYIVCENPEYKKYELMESLPALAKMTVLDGCDYTGEYGYVDIPLAYIEFFSWEQFQSKYLKEYRYMIRYFLFSDMDYERNKVRADFICDVLKEDNSFPVFIGILGSTINTYMKENICINYFGEKFCYRDENFYRKLVHRAYLIGELYARVFEDKKSLDYESFCKNLYKYRSSMENAMHLENKLYYMRILNLDERQASRFLKQKLIHVKDGSPSIYNNLLYSEHRRWIASMLVRGWDMYNKEQMQAIKYRKDSGYKDSYKKLHPCMVDCGRYNGRVLDRNNKEQWEREWLNISLGKSILDRLDKVSVYLHKRTKSLLDYRQLIIRNRIEEIQQEFCIIGKDLPDSWEKFKAVVTTGETQLYQEKLLLQEIYAAIENLEDPEILQYFDELYEVVCIRKEFEFYHDYKQTDGILIEYIPKLLLSN